ncbi:MAG TPA: hypothetical protein VFH63_08000 [candidate division Zixibacteria bacterium]|nr:hypothetical protein [candidate division Zixibacteria bacterium]
MDELARPIPLGAKGRLEAQPLTNAVGDHALLVRQEGQARALLTGEAAPAGSTRDRVVVVPMDEDVELRMDGDALAVWLATGSVRSRPGRGAGGDDLPGWASAIGLLLVVVTIGFAVLGSVTFFSWLLRVLS